MEAFAGQFATHVAWSKEVGRIESSESQAVITALILQDTAQPLIGCAAFVSTCPQRELSIKSISVRKLLLSIKDVLDVIERDSMRKRKDGTAREHLTPDGTAFVGAELFWYADKTPQVPALDAAYYFAPDCSGLYLGGCEGDGFRFPDQRASQLSQAIGRTMNELGSR